MFDGRRGAVPSPDDMGSAASYCAEEPLISLELAPLLEEARALRQFEAGISAAGVPSRRRACAA